MGKGGQRDGDEWEGEGKREGRKGEGDRGNGKNGRGYGMGRGGKGKGKEEGEGKAGKDLQHPNFNSWRRHCWHAYDYRSVGVGSHHESMQPNAPTYVAVARDDACS